METTAGGIAGFGAWRSKVPEGAVWYKLEWIQCGFVVWTGHSDTDFAAGCGKSQITIPVSRREGELGTRGLTRTEDWIMIEAMYGMGVDTLKAARALEKVGFEPAQAEALVAAFGGSVAGGAATREDLRDLRSANREDNRALRGEVAVVRTELKEEIAEVRTELKEEIAELRSEMRAEFVAVRGEIAEVRKEMNAMKADIADLKTGLVKVRSGCHDDIKSLKAQMYGLLLAQATLIVGLVVGLQRLL